MWYCWDFCVCKYNVGKEESGVQIIRASLWPVRCHFQDEKFLVGQVPYCLWHQSQKNHLWSFVWNKKSSKELPSLKTFNNIGSRLSLVNHRSNQSESPPWRKWGGCQQWQQCRYSHIPMVLVVTQGLPSDSTQKGENRAFLYKWSMYQVVEEEGFMWDVYVPRR